jgi:Flp pilus assembly protein TadB
VRSARRAEALRSRALVDALNDIADSLRSGASLRQALVRSARREGSPFRSVAEALHQGRPLSGVLHTAAVSSSPDDASATDPELASACCVLAVHAEAGGDPLPATRALAERSTRRAAAREEARALSTQARLGARAILLLTPGFFVLVAISDPQGATAWLRDGRTRTLVLFGVALQALGAWWIAAIVRGVAGGGSRWSQLPGLRVLRAVAVGRRPPTVDLDVADCAETVALASQAGLSATAALAAVAPYAHGWFGVALRDAVADVDVPLGAAIACRMDDENARRFADAVAASIDLGTPLAPALRSLSDELRERTSMRHAEEARRASMRVLAPLALLILPAFVMTCLVPLFLGGLQGIAG